MADKVKYTVQPRTITGKKVSQLRRERMIPANISGHTKATVSVMMPVKSFAQLYSQVGDTGLIYLKVEEETKERPVLVDDVQRHPVTGEVLHVVFKQVSLSEKIHAQIPVEVVGEIDIPESVLVTVVHEVEVEALPTELPDKFEADVSGFTEIGQTVTLGDLMAKYANEHVKFMDEDATQIVVALQAQKVEEEPEEVAPVEGEATTPEGETPVTETTPPAAE